MLREHRIRTTTAVAAAAVLLLGGCSGTIGAAPTPTPTPSWTCTPDDSGEPCTAEKAAAQAEQAEAYAEAEHAYREFTKERNRLAMSGGTPTPTPEMERLATGNYLDTVGEFLAAQYEAGQTTSAPLEVDSVDRVTYDTNQVTLRVCEDGRHILVLDVDGNEVNRGGRGAIEIEVVNGPQGWQLSNGRDVEDPACV